jgi:hypothetical protein
MQVLLAISKPTKVFLGGDPQKGQVPFVTMELKKAQIIIDQEKQTVTITEE